MPNKILIAILFILYFYLAPVTSLDQNYLGYSIGVLPTVDSFKYTITTGWNTQWKLDDTSQHIYVEGWTLYEDHKASPFYTEVGKQSEGILELLSEPKEATQSIYSTFKQNKKDMEMAFGDISNAKLYTVPQGRVLVSLRFQPTSTSKTVGRWSVLLHLIPIQEFKIEEVALEVMKKIKKHSLNPQVVASSLNIIPKFLSWGIFSTLKDYDGVRGLTKAVEYEGFIVVIRENQQFLAGAINDGQQGIIQVLHKVTSRKVSPDEL